MEYKGLNSVEYEYEKKVEGDYRMKRLLYVIACVVISVALMATVCLIGGPFVYTVPVIFMICLIFSRLFYRYFQISYRYTIEGGVFSACIVYASTIRKPYYKADLRNVKSIKPYDKDAKPVGTVYPSCISTKHASPELYEMRFVTDDGKEATAYFEATKDTLKVMKYFYPETVISASVRH